MATTISNLTAAQICQNAIENMWEYYDERIEELTSNLGTIYLCTFMHVAMISHWATMFNEPVLTMLTNFRTIPSTAIPVLAHIASPSVFPFTSGLSNTDLNIVDKEPELVYPPSNDDWEVQSVDDVPIIPVPPPQHHIYPEVLDHLHTLHVTPTPPMDILGPNCEPLTSTDPVPSMPSSPPQFLQADTQEHIPLFKQIVNALIQ